MQPVFFQDKNHFRPHMSTRHGQKPSHATVPVKATFTDPATGRGWVEGQVYRRPALADTLEQLAEAGDGLADLFYRGAIGRQLVAEVSVGSKRKFPCEKNEHFGKVFPKMLAKLDK
jgi:gamma-glutamyltranspeptidase